MKKKKIISPEKTFEAAARMIKKIKKGGFVFPGAVRGKSFKKTWR